MKSVAKIIYRFYLALSIPKRCRVGFSEMMGMVVLIFCTLFFDSSKAQFVKGGFRTVAEAGVPVHYLEFFPAGNAELRFPASHGSAMIGLRTTTYTLRYEVKGDTLIFRKTRKSYAQLNRIMGYEIERDSLIFKRVQAGQEAKNEILERFVKGKFLIKSPVHILELNSGYPYVRAKGFNLLVSLDDQIFKLKGDRKNRRLSKKLKKVELDDYTIDVVKGLQAYKKYGVDGIDGVIEVSKKSIY
jgi:hypothetical protein